LLDTIDLIARGLLYSMDNQLEQAIRACCPARYVALEDGHVFLAAQATEGLALAQYHQGRLRASAQSCRQVIDLAAHSPTPAPLAAAGYVELAGIHTEWNDLDTAADLLDKALALCRRWGIVQTLNEAYTAQSRLLLARGDIEAAWEALEKARDVSAVEGDRSLVNFRVATQQARLNLHAGNQNEVIQWAEGTKAAFASEEVSPLPASCLETLETMLARAYLAQDRAEESLAVLAPLLPPAEAAGANLRVIEIHALQALARHALGDTAAALAALERSLTLAEPQGFVSVYLDAGPPMAELLRQAISHTIMPEYAGRLLAAFAAQKAPSLASQPPHPPALIEPLTPRERDVLYLISRGLSNKDIALELVIALNTVKRHASNIYGKLGVKNRTQAVVRARELGLLPTGQE
jgi:LuxR family maltose regulon positive regulatory protein